MGEDKDYILLNKLKESNIELKKIVRSFDVWFQMNESMTWNDFNDEFQDSVNQALYK